MEELRKLVLKDMEIQEAIPSCFCIWDSFPSAHSGEPEFVVMQALIDARKESGMTQKELSAVTGISQADISRLEHGTGNPSIKTLQRIAKAFHMALKIEFVPSEIHGTR